MTPEEGERKIGIRVEEVLNRVRLAARRAGRDPEAVTLVGVTKSVGLDAIRESYQAGVRVFGESRVQEALPKLIGLTGDVLWHFIGHLQRNKVKQVVGRFDLIHSVDSVSLAREIGSRSAAEGKTQRILLEVNVSGESSKYGVCVSDVHRAVKEIVYLPGISLVGLMTIPPFREDPEGSRVYFKKLNDITRELGEPLRELSMGMSHDFEVAVEEGATLVRIGTAIFGERPIKADRVSGEA
jgi:hypothetical protein